MKNTNKLTSMNTELSEDISLLSTMRTGDRNAFERLFRKYYPLLCTYSYRFVQLEDAEEIVQDVMLWLWENRQTASINYSLKQYLLRAVYHRSMAYLIKNEAKQRIDAVYHERLMDSLQHTDVYQIEELSRRINQAIDELPETYREVFIKQRLRGESYKEIAKELNISPKTVDYRIQQSLKLLRIKLKDYLPLLLLLIEMTKQKI